jgi:hypothetical protein
LKDTELWISEIQDDLKLKRNIIVIHVSFCIETSMKEFLSSVYFVFMHHVFHATPIHVNLAESGPITILVSAVDHHS